MSLLHVPCPTCGSEVIWGPQSPQRPFCSERCRLIDLGAWAADEHRIPGDPLEADFVADERSH